MTATADRSRVGCIGTGLIGGGWVVHFLARGYDVVAWDPDRKAEQRLERTIDSAWSIVAQLGLAEGASIDRYTIADTLDEAVADVIFVQETGSEVLALKQDLLARIDRAAPPDAIISSSTSGLPMTQMQAQARQPERMVIGHPFNPSYLLPLVEVVGGQRTSPSAVQQAADFYEGAGKVVVRLDKEVTGFVANRLQEAMWREALQMVAAGEASVVDIDRAIVNGPGPRWAVFGPFMTYHMAVRDGGMRALLERLADGRSKGYARGDFPELDDDLKRHLIDGCAELQGTRSVSDWIDERDRFLAGILALRAVI